MYQEDLALNNLQWAEMYVNLRQNAPMISKNMLNQTKPK